MSSLKFAPQFSIQDGIEFARDIYGLSVANAESLPSERDQNFLLTEANSGRFVLKISGAAEERAFLEGQSAMMRHLAERFDSCPSVMPTTKGKWIAEVAGPNNRTHLVRLVTFLEGVPLADVPYHAPELLHDLGRRLGQMDFALEGFDHPSFHRKFQWDLSEAAAVVKTRLELIRDSPQLEIIKGFVDHHLRHTVPHLDNLPKNVIHSDANDGNVVVQQTGAPGMPATRIAGFIDFGDAVYSWTAGNLAIAVAYAILGKSDFLAAAVEVIKGYHSERPLSEEEIAVIFSFVCMRLSVSAVLAQEQRQVRPDDPYLTVSQEAIRDTMPRLAKIPHGFATAIFRQACGLAPVSPHDAVCDWLARHSNSFKFPISFSSVSTRLRTLDLSVGSPLLSSDQEAFSEPMLTRVIQDELRTHGANIGVGRYLEPRLMYTAGQFAEGDGPDEERRTVHLGVDLFADAGTEVRAPLDGIVSIVHKNSERLNYGHLVILRHETNQGDALYTLYGHLAARTHDHLRVGQSVSAGETIAWLGVQSENGGWPPHLHFQIILDLLDLGADFPGVGHASKSDVWAALSPDPNRILSIPTSLIPPTAPAKETALRTRRKMIGHNLSLGYRNPLKIVRGWKQYLYDETGRRYIDAYNNVPHVGHCHPEVVDAAQRQLKLLNTNTRYLSDLLNEYAERLAATMPDPLNVCYILNSASEANELALRLARAHTRQKDMIVLDGAYHGNTTTLIDISPYKHDGPGGLGAPDWVHVTPIPDVYRGRHRDPQTAGKAYADEVCEVLERLRSDQRGLCGFIAESCPSVGGQIIFPKRYLQEVYKRVRATGGVCIADDVQTGYGRLGDVFYGFELQDVVPDIVVLGKPIGNGHPIAAVVTTQPVAESFDNGMEFFSTFGGNTVSCAVGTAVLGIVQREQLQIHALNVGEHLLTQFHRLKKKFPVIGDVRGAGLFLGMELVRDSHSLEPAANEASFVSNRMRDRGILLGVDGPAQNVIKIRPPMPFSLEDGDILVEMLGNTLEELG